MSPSEVSCWDRHWVAEGLVEQLAKSGPGRAKVYRVNAELDKSDSGADAAPPEGQR